MQEKVLELGERWTLGKRIGGGGFGQVFEARSQSGKAAVAKLVPKTLGAARELLFVNLSEVRNVVPVIDSGETVSDFVLVMPHAEKSLRQHLTESGGSLDVETSVGILIDIATTLTDLEGRVVHRDLKPENVLLLDGRWCLADFGISRYAEATTAADTQKYAWSPPYAAPERWRNERATAAADVYALGIVAYEMFSGSRPFSGSSNFDYREQHLHGKPSDLDMVETSFAALIEECLYKSPEARPSPSNFLARISKIKLETPPEGLSRLQEASRAEGIRRGEAIRRESEARSEEERRASLFDAASTSLSRISESFRQSIEQVASAARISTSHDGSWGIQLKQARLEFESLAKTSTDPWEGRTAPVFEVIAHAAIGILLPPDIHGYEGRVHSLWFCDAHEPTRFQWFETAFMISPIIPKRSRKDPFGLNPGEKSAKALGGGMAEIQLAWPFTPLIVGELDEFTSRWAGWFADAAQARLGHPRSMPERDPNGSWRRA